MVCVNGGHADDHYNGCMSDLRYPIGQWKFTDRLTAAERVKAIDTIAGQAQKMRSAVAGLSQAQLDTPYRDGGWSLRQVIHHVPDSHMNGYIRTKFALTQDDPTVMAYDEDAWAKLGDIPVTPVETSVALFESVNARWAALLRSLSSSQFERSLRHSASGPMKIDSIVSNYSWHGLHHIAQITSLRERSGW